VADRRLGPGHTPRAGRRELTPGDVAVFPEGPAGGHQVINRWDDLCRVLILSSKSPVAVVHYPDSGKVGLWTQAEGGARGGRRGGAGRVRQEPSAGTWSWKAAVARSCVAGVPGALPAAPAMH
jgi:hypothetical protein